MLLNLYNLFNRSSTERTPLEDFTTECFAGILNHHPIVRQSFAKWMGLPEGRYKVSTQRKYILEGDPNCIIDMVLECEHTICFIENKVNSKEGWEQLRRYTDVLDQMKEHKQTHLKYCTKHVDIKPNESHHFFQYRWHEVANWLNRHHPDIALVTDFLIFLKRHQMTQDTSITAETVITMNHFLQTYEAMDFHIKNALPAFLKQFPKAAIEKQESIPKIREHDRISRYTSRIVTDHSKHSELLYCIHFETVKLQTQIWISLSHPLAEILYERAKESGHFQTWKDEIGIGIYVDCKLYQFIEDKNSDQLIQDWFLGSFAIFRQFIAANPDIPWDQNVL